MKIGNRRAVRPSVVRATENMLWSVTLDLNLRRPGEVPWMSIAFVHREKIGRKVYGTFNPVTLAIELTHTMAEATAAETVAHELRHLWQVLNWPAEKLRSKVTKERDCEQYEIHAMNRFWNPYLVFGGPERALGMTRAA